MSVTRPSLADLGMAFIAVGVGVGLTSLSPPEGTGLATNAATFAIAVPVVVLTAFRRSAPLPLLGAVTFLTVLLPVAFDAPPATLFACLLLLQTAAIQLDRLPAIGVGVVMAVVLYVPLIIVTPSEVGDPRVLIVVAWTIAAIGIADAARAWRGLKAETEARVLAAQQAAELRVSREVSEERLSIARELHDLLAHNLSVMNVQTGVAAHFLRDNPDAAETALATARDAGRDVLDELRDLLGVLRSEDGTEASTDALPDLDRVGELVERVRNAGLSVRWERRGTAGPMTPGVSLAGYRIVQEALTNAARYGTGSARLVTAVEDDMLTIVVENPVGSGGIDASGPELPASGSGLGLVGIRERVVAHGGTVQIADDGGRFRLEVTLPLSRVSETSR